MFEQLWEDRQIIGAVTLPTGLSRDNEGQVRFHEVFSLAPDERLYGLGEHFTSFDRRGQRIVSWTRDPVGALTSTATYVNVPLVISSRGFGLFFHHHSKITYELGNPALQTAAIRVGDPYLDYFFIYGPVAEGDHRALHGTDGPRDCAAEVVVRSVVLALHVPQSRAGRGDRRARAGAGNPGGRRAPRPALAQGPGGKAARRLPLRMGRRGIPGSRPASSNGWASAGSSSRSGRSRTCTRTARWAAKGSRRDTSRKTRTAGSRGRWRTPRRRCSWTSRTQRRRAGGRTSTAPTCGWASQRSSPTTARRCLRTRCSRTGARASRCTTSIRSSTTRRSTR